MKKIAILGAGFCGIACAYHLLQKQPNAHITVFDPAGVGGGASGIASGLMHPYAGARAKQSPHALEGMQETQRLLEVSSKALGQSVWRNTGLLRLAISDEQKIYFAACAAKHPDVQWWTSDQCKAHVPGIATAEGIWIPSGITVDTKRYLEGLWLVCQQAGVQLVQMAISSLQQLESYDVTIVAVGGGIRMLSEFSHLPFSFLKGQVLEFLWPETEAVLPFPINSQAYLVPNGKTCLAGGTYERKFLNGESDLPTALQELTPKIKDLLPNLKDLSVINCRAGIRVYAPDHLPFVQQFSKKCWIITGMGSKGLLYHSLFAKKLINHNF